MKIERKKISKIIPHIAAIAGIASIVTTLIISKDFITLDDLPAMATGVIGSFIAIVATYLLTKARKKNRELELKLKKIEVLKTEIDHLLPESSNQILFVSHSHVDKKLANEFVKNLNDLNDIKTFTFDNSIKLGDNIYSKLKESDYFLFIITPNWLKSPNSLKELNFALENQKKIFPIVINDTTIPNEISNLKYKVINDKEEGDVVEGVEEILESLKQEIQESK